MNQTANGWALIRTDEGDEEWFPTGFLRISRRFVEFENEQVRALIAELVYRLPTLLNINFSLVSWVITQSADDVISVIFAQARLQCHSSITIFSYLPPSGQVPATLH